MMCVCIYIRATRALCERDDVIVVSTVSCIYGLGLPAAYVESRATLYLYGIYIFVYVDISISISIHVYIYVYMYIYFLICSYMS